MTLIARFFRHRLVPMLLGAFLLIAGCGSSNDDDTGGGSLACTGTGNSTGNIMLDGRATFDRVPHAADSGLDYGNTAAQPIRGAIVQALCGSELYASGVTGTDGGYSFAVPNNTVMQIRVHARMQKTGAAPTWDFRVVDNTNNQALYVLDTDTFDSGDTDLTRNAHAESGWGGSSYTGARAAAPFAILDSAYRAFNKILEVDSDAVFSPLLLNWSVNNRAVDGDLADGDIGTSFYNNGEIYILGDEDADTDEYDGHVIIHEWGHYFEDRFSRSDSVGGPHGPGDRLDMRVAYGEGFGNAWSGMVTDDPFYRDSFGNQQSQGFDIDVENDNDTSTGWYSETSVQAILYDLYDATNDPAHADTITLDLAPLYAVWINEQRTGVPLTTIYPLAQALRDNNPGDAADITALLEAQMIFGDDEWGTGETNDAGQGTNVLPVYTELDVPGTADNICSTKTNGEYNALGNRRFVHLTVIGSSGTYNITVSNGDDPDWILHQAGEIDRSEAFGGPETKAVNLQSGQEYVLEIYDFANIDGNGGTGGTACLNVGIN